MSAAQLSSDFAILPRIDLGISVPMRDGLELSGRLYRPQDGSGPFPTIVHFTVYISSSIHERAKSFTRMGFAVLAVDARGRAESGGQFRYDGSGVGEDGSDIITWVTQQHWSNGDVFTRGGSALGNIQWQILAQAPKGLRASAPFAAAKAGYDSEYINNILRLDRIPWGAYVYGRVANNELYEDEEFWHETFLCAHREHWPLERLAGVLGPNTSLPKEMQELAARAGDFEHWQLRDVVPEGYARIDQFVLSFTGYYDGNQAGTLYRHAQHMRHGPTCARDRHFLIIGPWGHHETMVAKRNVLGQTFGSESEVARDELQRDFFKWAAGCGDRPPFLQKNIGWYVTGREEWRWADTLEEVSPYEAVFKFAAETNPDTLSQPGSLTQSEPYGDPARFRCDPFCEDVAYGGRPEPEDLLRSTAVFALNGKNGLCYETDPLDGPMEISGSPVLNLALRADVPDFDVSVFLHEVFKDGSVFLLTESFFRARWCGEHAEESLMPEGAVERRCFKQFQWFSREVAAGSRIRVTILHLNNPTMQRNYNAGKPVARQTPDDARIGTIELMHCEPDPSILRLPLSRLSALAEKNDQDT